MKVELSFSLPDEQQEFEEALNGCKYKRILSELDKMLRSKLKHSELEEQVYETYHQLRKELWNLINEEKIDIH